MCYSLKVQDQQKDSPGYEWKGMSCPKPLLNEAIHLQTCFLAQEGLHLKLPEYNYGADKESQTMAEISSGVFLGNDILIWSFVFPWHTPFSSGLLLALAILGNTAWDQYLTSNKKPERDIFKFAEASVHFQLRTVDKMEIPAPVYVCLSVWGVHEWGFIPESEC